MPATRYAKSGDLSIAYQVIGSGPPDLIYVPGWVSNIEVMWEDSVLARSLERLASFSRLIIFDKRGTGLSDAVDVDELPGLEERMDDLRAVMDAVNSERAVLFGHSEGGNLCVLFAATFPQRTEALILAGSYAARIWSPDYPWAPTWEERLLKIEETERSWGDPELARAIAPSRIDDPAFRSWIQRYFRLSASPRAAAALMRMNSMIDVRPVLSSIRSPTLLLYRRDDRDVLADEGRYMASKIPGSQFVELDGADHLFYAGDSESLIGEIESFVTGRRSTVPHDRVLSTVLFTDVVASTETAARMGDLAWRDLIERHNALVRAAIERWRGREIKTTGDGFLATFDGPARAIRCGKEIVSVVQTLGLNVRCGIHTGEVEAMGSDVAGLAVHIGARIGALAGPNEVLVSRTVKDLVAGSGLEFVPRGAHTLKGVPDQWEIHAVV